MNERRINTFIYRIAQGEYEYYSEYLLSHTKCYTKEEYNNIVIGAIKYNRKYKDDDNELFDIKQTLIDIYGFQEYKIPIQASVYDDWSLATYLSKEQTK